MNNKVNRVIEPIVKYMLKDMPEDPVDFMLKYIKENLGDKASKHRNE